MTLLDRTADCTVPIVTVDPNGNQWIRKVSP
ncbi:hypothetical protein SAMN05421539_10513 [Jannaschia seohaensis]|uniref:Uncharacterized protein n=1 Tax=Jannaschia seohaensis TaxID=475081 RepID=A0A2Y9AWU0_9RHOB|nr:hypothetical protein BCF38_10513 [Jannaschia seohaensis]SSA46549.1 hypothetical protein SAMN05421539_10513 [Jannaschia seohaensis]